MDIQDLCIYRKLQPQEEPVEPDVIVETGTFTTPSSSRYDSHKIEIDFDVDKLLFVNVETDKTDYSSTGRIHSIASRTDEMNEYETNQWYGIYTHYQSNAKQFGTSVMVRIEESGGKTYLVLGGGYEMYFFSETTYSYELYIKNS